MPMPSVHAPSLPIYLYLQPARISSRFLKPVAQGGIALLLIWRGARLPVAFRTPPRSMGMYVMLHFENTGSCLTGFQLKADKGAEGWNSKNTDSQDVICNVCERRHSVQIENNFRITHYACNEIGILNSNRPSDV